MPKGKAKAKESKPIEQTLWDAANKLRGKVEPAEYKHVVLSMIFLKYANDRFNEHRKQMIADGQQAFLEMMPFYTKDNVFYIPECARWSFIMENAKQPDIAIIIDTALAVPKEEDIKAQIATVVKEIQKGHSMERIALRHGWNVDLVEQIARLYVTHPGVTVDGILEKMGVK